MTESRLIEPFVINFPESDLADLRDRLARTRWPDELDGVGWSYGVPVSYLKPLAEYWRTGYDWWQAEYELNQLPQFVTTIDGERIHFLHARSTEANAQPLLMTHGWPGSIVEFLDVIGPLTDPIAHGGKAEDAFDLVIPSIPGFGLSGPTHETGWDVDRIVRAWAELMERLGYERYGVQGGDWGSGISRGLAVAFAARVTGVHLNYLPTPPATDLLDPSPEEEARMEQTRRYLAQLPGHIHVQSTRPQTLAFALTDSPVGQLAWLAEKFHEWHNSTIEISDDRLLTNVMLYWMTETAASSSRLYFETAGFRSRPPIPCEAPMGVAVFAHDLVRPVRRLAERINNIVHWSEFDRGGHFPAMEVPDLPGERHPGIISPNSIHQRIHEKTRPKAVIRAFKQVTCAIQFPPDGGLGPMEDDRVAIVPRDAMVLGSTIVFAPYSLEQALEGLAAAGYRNCEIGAVKGWFEHIDPDTASDKEIDFARQKLRDLGLTPVSLSGHTQLQTTEGKERFRRALDIAAALGMSIVNTFTGDASTESEREAYFTNVQDLCDYAATLGLKIGMETDSNMLPTAAIGVAILDPIDRPATLGFNYDPGNVVYYSGADPIVDIQIALPRMVHFHLKDKIGGKGVFNFPPPGDGELDLARMLELCAESGYSGPISAEVEFDEKGWPSYELCLAAAKRSVANLRTLGLTV